jgi:general secretion pathway protein D
VPASAPARFTRIGSGDAPGPVTGSSAAPPGEQPSVGTRFTLNFVEVEIAEVARVILGDMLGVPFVIDPRVRGPVTVEAAAGVPRAALIPTLQAALRSQGAGLIQGPQGFEVVPIAEARRPSSGIGRGTTGILPVAPRFASAPDMLRAATLPER